MIFTPVPRAKPQAAVGFLLENAFRTPTYFLDLNVLRRIEQSGTVDRLRQTLAGLLAQLFNDARLSRLVEQGALATTAAPAYRLTDLLGDVRRGLFSEVATRGPIDVYRRNLQRSFVTLLGDKVASTSPGTPSAPVPVFPGFPPPPPRSEEARALIRGELKDLDAAIATALPRVTDRESSLHLQDLRYRIDRILNPKT